MPSLGEEAHYGSFAAPNGQRLGTPRSGRAASRSALSARRRLHVLALGCVLDLRPIFPGAVSECQANPFLWAILDSAPQPIELQSLENPGGSLPKSKGLASALETELQAHVNNT